MSKLEFVRRLALAGAACALAACADMAAQRSPPFIPLALGDYAAAPEAKLAADFAAAVSGRYAPGSPVADAAADLGRNQFACAPPAPSKAQGAPPAEVCRRSIVTGGCTHTWQVHLYGGAKGGVTRARGLYDKTCGEELLGGR